jgi:hypothetical protein
MSRAQSEPREKSKSDGGIAVIWLILYAIGFLDILVLKPSHKMEVALAKPAIHTLAVANQTD